MMSTVRITPAEDVSDLRASCFSRKYILRGAESLSILLDTVTDILNVITNMSSSVLQS